MCACLCCFHLTQVRWRCILTNALLPGCLIVCRLAEEEAEQQRVAELERQRLEELRRLEVRPTPMCVTHRIAVQLVCVMLGLMAANVGSLLMCCLYVSALQEERRVRREAKRVAAIQKLFFARWQQEARRCATLVL